MRLLAVLVVFVATASYGAEISQHARNALEFKYKSVGVGAALEDCEAVLGEPTEVDPFRNQAAYNLPSGNGRWTNIKLVSGRVWSITALLTSDEVGNIGGESVIQAKLVDQYGRPREEAGGVFSWEFEEVNRLIAYAAKEGTVVITVQVLNGADEELSERADDVDSEAPSPTADD